MSKPINLSTKIFLDSGDPKDTLKALSLLGFLDGQTTNPTLVSKHPFAKSRFESGQKFSKDEIFEFYKNVVSDISKSIPKGSVSIEVYSDSLTTAEDMYNQAKDMWTWIPNAHIKFPTSKNGLKAAHKFAQEGGRVNMTLCFSQEQGAAVYSATKGSKRGDVFYSSFVGRLFDDGIDGIEQLKNCIKMYKKGDRHVEVLACSFRNIDQFLASLQAGVDIATVPLTLIQQWVDMGMPIPDNSWKYDDKNTKKPEFRDLDLKQEWGTFDIYHPLTEKGIARFASDWNGLVD